MEPSPQQLAPSPQQLAIEPVHRLAIEPPQRLAVGPAPQFSLARWRQEEEVGWQLAARPRREHRRTTQHGWLKGETAELRPDELYPEIEPLWSEETIVEVAASATGVCASIKVRFACPYKLTLMRRAALERQGGVDTRIQRRRASSARVRFVNRCDSRS